MARITFNIADLMPLIRHAKEAESHHGVWGQDCNKPALLLVGDEGIYFMSNGEPGLPIGENVAYANESNPKVMDRDVAYDAKRRFFGGDDGVELLEGWLETIEKLVDKFPDTKLVEVSISPDELALVVPKTLAA